MPRIFKTAQRLDSILRRVPRLRKKVDEICVEYHRIQENFDYDIATNGERWLVQKLAAEKLLETAFDVGVNHAEWSALVLNENPAAAVHGFEICPPTFQKAAAVLAGKKGAFLNSFGLSNAAGQIKIKYNPNNDGATTIYDMVQPADTVSIDATVATGRDYCAEHGVKKIDMIKLDVEGAEHLVLQGFGDMVNPATISVVQFEYGMVNILTKFLLKDFYEFFESRGYRVGKLYPNFVRFKPYRVEDEDFLGPNYVAASPAVAALLDEASAR